MFCHSILCHNKFPFCIWPESFPMTIEVFDKFQRPIQKPRCFWKIQNPNSSSSTKNKKSTRTVSTKAGNSIWQWQWQYYIYEILDQEVSIHAIFLNRIGNRTLEKLCFCNNSSNPDILLQICFFDMKASNKAAKLFKKKLYTGIIVSRERHSWLRLTFPNQTSVGRPTWR